MKLITRIIIHFFIFSLAALFIVTKLNKPQVPKALNGQLNISSVDLKSQGPVRLRGEWDFYWKQLINIPSTSQLHNPGNFKIPSGWKGKRYKGEKLPNDGFASFGLKVVLNNTNKKLALKIPVIHSAYKIWVNQKLIASSGQIGKSKDTAIPEITHAIGDFSTDTHEIQIFLQISNFHHTRGGIFGNIWLGTKDQILKKTNRKLILESIIFFYLLITGIFHIIFYFSRKSKTEILNLYFGIVCLIIGLRSICMGQMIIKTIIPSISYNMVIRIEWFPTFLSISLAVLFLQYLYPEEKIKFLNNFFIISGIFGAFITLLTPVKFFTSLFYPLLFLAFFFSLYFLYILITAIKNNKKNTFFLMIGVFVFIITLLNDTLFYLGYINTGNLITIGIMSIIFSHSLNLFLRFVKTFNRTEREELKLQELVKIRSGNLENSYSRLKNEIDQHKKTTKKLNKNLEWFKAIFENSPVAYYLYNSKGILIDGNRFAEKMIGYKKKEIIGKSLFKTSILPIKEIPKAIKILDQNLKGKPTGPSILTLKPKNREHITVEIWTVIIRLESEKQYLGIARDITNSLKSEKSLKESEEKFRSLAETTPLGILLLQNNKWIYANPAVTTITGFSKRELYKSNYLQIFHPRSHDEIKQSNQSNQSKFDSKKSKYSNEIKLINKNGNETWIFLHSISILYQGKSAKLYSILDIDKLKISEQKIKKQTKISQNLSRYAAEFVELPFKDDIFRLTTANLKRIIGKGIVSIASCSEEDDSYQIKSFQGLNKRMTKLVKILGRDPVGYKVDGLANISSTFFNSKIQPIKPIASAKMKGLIARLASDAVKSLLKIDKVYGSGIIQSGRLLGIVVIIPFTQLNEQTLGAAQAYLDLAAQALLRRRSEEALQTSKDAAESANKAKSEFLANMSHEIRTPLNAIIGFSDLLSDLVHNKMEKEYLDSIKTSGKSLLTLINDILDLSKIEAGKMDLNQTPMNLQLILNEIKQIFSEQIREKGLELKTITGDNLPANLILDESKIRQVLLNMVGNAIKFTHKGYIKISVTYKQKTEKPNEIDLIIAIRDTGIGIPKDDQERIFESFKQQEGQSTRKYGGTGLGLTISRRLIGMMNGSLSVESKLHSGSTFTICLKNVNIPIIHSPKEITEETKPVNYQFEPSKILIVDDVQSNRNLLIQALKKFNLEVITACNGQEGVDKALAQHPGVIIMDIRMPVMDGITAAGILKKEPATSQIPIIGLTASVETEKFKTTEKNQFDSLLYKPINISELIHELSRFLKTTERVKQIDNKIKPPHIDNLNNHKNNKQLIDVINQQILPDLQIFSKTLIFDEIQEFSVKLKKLGKQHSIPYLIAIGERLKNQAESFNIKRIKKILKDLTIQINNLS